MKTSWMKLSAIGIFAAVGTGCVPQSKYDDLQTLYRTSQEQVATLQAQNDEANARAKALQDAATRGGSQVITIKETDPAVQADRDRLAAQVALLESKLRDAGKIEPIMLEAEVDNALSDFAKANPGLLTYDSKLGMVRFKSDLTFALGSVEVNPAAAAALRKFAEILKTQAASKYEVRIIGYTDNVPITKPETKLRYPTNWYLSAARAISVKDQLANAGINQSRMVIGGTGEYRPLVPNGQRGAEQNRRVEIYLVTNTYTGPGLSASQATRAAAPAPAAAPARTTPPPSMMK